MPKKSPLFIVDGSSFLYRAYYAMRPLQTSKGVPVQAVYGFCRMIKKLIKDFKVERIVIAWDSKGKTTRHDFFPDYKANRQKPPSDIFDQKKLIVEFIEAINIAQISQVGIEADDLIYSLAQKFNSDKHDVMIVSGDKDLAQMVNDKTKMFDPFKEKVFDQEALEEKYEFPLAKLPFFFSILGDSSDNIPGVKGIGKKGATDLVQMFESLDDLYENINKIDRRRTKELLLDQKDNAHLSLKLFTLQNYRVETSLEETVFLEDSWQKALPLLKKVEFKSLIKEIESKATTQQALFQPALKNLHETYNFILVDDTPKLKQLSEKIKNKKSFAIDTETTGLNPMIDPCVGISIAIEQGTAYYIPFGHKTNETQLTLEEVKEELLPIFSDTTIKKFLHHAKFDQVVLWAAGLPLQGVTFDTLIAASLIVKDWQKKGLKQLSEFYFDETMLSFDDMMKEGNAQDFSDINLQSATKYAAADAHQTLKLKDLFEQSLKKEGVDKFFYEIEMPVNDILVAMQIAGIYCDETVLATLNTAVSADLKEIESKIKDLSGEEINLNSPKQVKQLLFEKLNLPPQKKSAKKTGYSTDAGVLKELSKIHPVPELLLKYRELFKLKSTYIESLPAYINTNTNHIHTSFNQTLVATGRLSSSNPNLQNIPTGDLGYEIDIRSAFKSEGDNLFLSADYSQIELRILAHMSQDKSLQEAFANNEDIHTKTAAKIFDIAEKEVSTQQRAVGKKINFSILYGLTPYGLSKDLEISYKEAQSYIEAYFDQYPNIKVWMESIVDFTKEHGYTKTLYGRKRDLPGIHEKNRILYDLAKRMAINTAVQGTAAEIMKIGMIKLQKEFDKRNSNVKMLLQIHDELIFSVPKDELKEATNVIKKCLESVVSWNIPLIVQTQSGKTWHDVTK